MNRIRGQLSKPFTIIGVSFWWLLIEGGVLVFSMLAFIGMFGINGVILGFVVTGLFHAFNMVMTMNNPDRDRNLEELGRATLELFGIRPKGYPPIFNRSGIKGKRIYGP